jgi:8-oxo-dGTP diphosphatase
MAENAFEAGRRKVIPAVLVYAFEGPRVLLIHRVAPDHPDDYHAGKWNGLGGKLEPDESPLEAALRELAEESGLRLPEERFRGLGCLQFPNFKAHRSEDWVVFVFRADVLEEEARDVPERTDEGKLHWISPERLPELGFWPGDRHFLPHVVSGTSFMGSIWYRGQDVERHWIQTLS